MLKRWGFVRLLLGLVLSTVITMIVLGGTLIWKSTNTVRSIFDISVSALTDTQYEAALVRVAALAHSSALAAVAENNQETRAVRIELVDGFLSEFMATMSKCGVKCESVNERIVSYQSEWLKVRNQLKLTSIKNQINVSQISENAEKIFEVLDKAISEHGKKAIESLVAAERAEVYKNRIITVLAGFLVLLISVCGFLFQRAVAKSLQEVSEVIVQAVMQSDGTVVQLHEQSQKMSSSSDLQLSAIHQTSSAVDEIQMMAGSVSQSTENSNKLSESAEEAAERGHKDLVELINSISEIKNGNDNVGLCSEQSTKDLYEIVQMITDIKNKTQVINEIVFQTRLLSFNASVEAARAGESGKGFSVVAEEVGRLATMSGTSANEISHLLEAGTRQVQDIVEKTTSQMSKLLAAGQSKIHLGQLKAAQCKESFEGIVASMSDLRQQIQQVSGAIREQSEGIKEISEATKRISEAGEGAVGSIRLVSTQANEMRSKTEQLKQANNDLTVLIHGAGATTNRRAA